MAWIESHTVLIRHRKLIDLARRLRIQPVHAMGVLHALWHAALEQQEDGDLSSWPDDLIADLSCAPKNDAPQYVRHLQESGWLDGKRLHDWLEYAGRYLESKYRSKKSDRLMEIWGKHGLRYGEVDRRGLTEDGPGSDLGQPTQPNPTVPDITSIPHSPQRGPAYPLPSWFEAIWEQYPSKDGKKAAERHFRSSVKTLEDFEAIKRALKNYLGSERVRKGFVKNGSTWFNNWRDWVNYVESPKEPGPGKSPKAAVIPDAKAQLQRLGL
jgi:hypothetical protein